MFLADGSIFACSRQEEGCAACTAKRKETLTSLPCADAHLYGLGWASASNDFARRLEASRKSKRQMLTHKAKQAAKIEVLARPFVGSLDAPRDGAGSGKVIAPWAQSSVKQLEWTSCAGKTYKPIPFNLAEDDDWSSETASALDDEVCSIVRDTSIDMSNGMHASTRA